MLVTVQELLVASLEGVGDPSRERCGVFATGRTVAIQRAVTDGERDQIPNGWKPGLDPAGTPLEIFWERGR